MTSRDEMVKLREVRTYEVAVNGFDPHLYYGPTPAMARARAHRAYQSYRSISFREFLKISRVRRVANPAGVGEPILVQGRPAFRVYHPYHGSNVPFVYEDAADVVLFSHPSDVSTLIQKDTSHVRS